MPLPARWRDAVLALSALTAAVLLLTPAALAQRIDAAITDDAIATFVATYHKRPDPLRLPAILKAAQDNGYLRDKARRHVVIGFLAGLIAEDAKYVTTLAPYFADLPSDLPLRLPRAIAYSGRADWLRQMQTLKSLWPMKAAEIEAIIRDGGKSIPKLPVDLQALALDLNWGYFGATGRKEPVQAIIAGLAGADDKANPVRISNAYAAKLSLVNNALKNDRVLAWCREAQTGVHAAHMKSVVEAVQARDPDRIRREGDEALKDATRLIEEAALVKAGASKNKAASAGTKPL